MKSKILFLTLAISAVALTTGCSDNDKAVPAKVSIAVEQTNLEVNQSMNVNFTGSADHVVIYPGDSGHNYELRDSANSGLVVNKGIFSYSYPTPGTYKVVCVATNHEDMGRSFFSDTCSVWVKVIDDITEITRLSAPAVIYDEVFAEAVNDRDWLLAIPRKVHYKNSDPSVNLKKQKLKFYIESLTTGVTLKDHSASDEDYAPYSSATQYNLEKVWDIRTTSNEGTVRDYRLFTLNYGEFKSFSAAGIAGKIVRTEYDYSYYTIDITVPSGTDLTKVAPVFTLYGDNEKVYLPDGSPAVSGQAVDFSDPVTYRFVVSSPENPDIKVESTCKVTIMTE